MKSTETKKAKVAKSAKAENAVPLKITHHEPYGRLRARAYPPVGEQMDAILKLVQALYAQGIKLPDETRAWMEKCEAVKQRYVKKPIPDTYRPVMPDT